MTVADNYATASRPQRRYTRRLSDDEKNGDPMRSLRTALTGPITDLDSHTTAQLDRHLETWMRGLNIPETQRKHLIGEGCGSLSAALFPNAADPARLLLGAKWVTTVTLIDEHCDRPAWRDNDDRAARWIEADPLGLDRAGRAFMRPHDQAETPILRMLRSARLDLERTAGADAADQMHQIMSTVLHLHTTEALWHASGQMPTVREYLLCHQVSAYRVPIGLLDTVGDYHLPTAVVGHPAMGRVTRTAAQAAGLLNDCYSAEWEGKDDFNIIRCLRHEHGYDNTQAATAATELHNQAMADFDDACATLANSQLPEPKARARYLDDLRTLLAGNHTWHQHTNRYDHEPRSPQ